MNQSSHEEFEEVESPFKNKSTHQSRLRSRKSTFNRPFAADPSMAPAVFENKTRKSIARPDEVDLNDFRQSSLADTEINYLENDEDELEEEEVAPKPVRRQNSVVKKKTKKNLGLLTKITWSIVGLLTLRLLFMDRGVWDYFVTENAIQDKQEELRTIDKENRELRHEIDKIKYDKSYQRLLAKEHLGVIAADEFLILFAGETPDPSESSSGDANY
jgi:cell division protein FtsB